MICVTSLPLAPFSRSEWQGWLTVMLTSAGLEPNEEGAGSPPASVELVLMRDGDIAALNSTYLGCPGPTNILSFPAASEQPGIEGDVEKGAVRDNPASAGMYRGVADKSSFKSPSGAGPDRTARNLGSLFLSVDTLRRECLLYGQDEAEHARRLLAHGLAHLLGYDHGPAMDAVCETMLASRFA